MFLVKNFTCLSKRSKTVVIIYSWTSSVACLDSVWKIEIEQTFHPFLQFPFPLLSPWLHVVTDTIKQNEHSRHPPICDNCHVIDKRTSEIDFLGQAKMTFISLLIDHLMNCVTWVNYRNCFMYNCQLFNGQSILNMLRKISVFSFLLQEKYLP